MCGSCSTVIEETYTSNSEFKGTVAAAYGYTADGLHTRFDVGSGGAFDFLYDPQGNLVARQASCQSHGVYGIPYYEAYGAMRSDFDFKSSMSVPVNPPYDPVDFGGQDGDYTDLETDLIFCTHRYYDPGTGRWLTRDPIGYAGGVNLYGYCGGNPVNRADPEGTDDLDNVQMALTGAGAFPVVGAIPDAVSAGISIYQGDWVGAGLSVAAIAPFVGDAAAAGKIAKIALIGDRAIGAYGKLRKILKTSKCADQANHLFQDAVFGSKIAKDAGVSINLEGDALLKTKSEHRIFHQALEEFWSAYRSGGPLADKLPSIAEYADATIAALKRARVANDEVEAARGAMESQLAASGLEMNDRVMRIPGPMNLGHD